jgi:hypothetical protein
MTRRTRRVLAAGITPPLATAAAVILMLQPVFRSFSGNIPVRAYRIPFSRIDIGPPHLIHQRFNLYSG